MEPNGCGNCIYKRKLKDGANTWVRRCRLIDEDNGAGNISPRLPTAFSREGLGCPEFKRWNANGVAELSLNRFQKIRECAEKG